MYATSRVNIKNGWKSDTSRKVFQFRNSKSSTSLEKRSKKQGIKQSFTSEPGGEGPWYRYQ